MASGGDDGTVRVWKEAAGTELRSFVGHAGRVRTIAWSSDGTMLASCGEDTLVRVWDAEAGVELRTFSGHGGAVWSVAWSPDDRMLASGGSDRTLTVWDVATGGRTFCVVAGEQVSAVDFSRDGGLAIAADRSVIAYGSRWWG